MSYISIGECTKYNIYILISLIFDLFNTSLFGINTSNKEKPGRIFSFSPKIKKHNLLSAFVYFGACFFGGIFLLVLEKLNNKGKNELVIEKFQKLRRTIFHSKNESLKLNLFLGVIMSLYIIFKDFIDTTGVYVGFWTFEIMYICIISRFIFKIKIYKHRRMAIYIMFVLTVIEFIQFFSPKTKHENKENMNELTDKNVFDIIIIKFGTYAIPLLFLANELNHIQRDYCWMRYKYLMDTKSYAPSKILMTMGGFGFIFVMVLFPFFTYIPCKTFNNIIKEGNSYINLDTNKPLELYKEYCSVQEYDENTKTLYLLYDSIKLITQEYSNTNKENMLEIFLVIPISFISRIIIEISYLMLIRYTDPNNILISKNFYFIIKRLICIIINKGDEQYMTYFTFFTKEFLEIIFIISNMIYIEVLELKFCELDYELKKNISERSINEITENFIENPRDTVIDLGDDEDEKQDEYTSEKSDKD